MRDFYYHPRELGYTFPPGHPFRSERLSNAVLLLQRLGLSSPVDFEDANELELERVHAPRYVTTLRRVSERIDRGGITAADVGDSGLNTADTPVFSGLWEAACAVAGGTRSAARALVEGRSVAVHLAGGLHHARRDRASGFCAVHDIALGIETLRARFSRIAYIDLDLHHGDGPEHTYAEDPEILTASIHQYGDGFFPGSGGLEAAAGTVGVLNAPLPAGTDGQTWLRVFRDGVLPCVEAFAPDAVVLQLGVDAHVTDPLGSLNVLAQEWFSAVKLVHALGLPTLLLGGGGYDPRNPPRMWAAAVCAFSGVEVPEEIPSDLVEPLGIATFFDHSLPRRESILVRARAEDVLQHLRRVELPRIRG